jgi:hypothetical protein
MAGYANNISNLLNKIEMRLGTKPLNLPADIAKDKWADVIRNDTLVTFSRYYPHKFKYLLGPEDKKDGCYYLDEDKIGGLKILGLRDLSWEDFATDSLGVQESSGYGIYDFYGANYDMADVSMFQMRADHMSMFNRGIYPVFEPPNKIRLQSATAQDIGGISKFHVWIFVEHNPNLTTISPTQMETFEALAQADIAQFLYRYLKYYDQLQTVYATIDLKLQDLETEAGKRDEVINYIKESYVSASNANQPLMMTI